MLGNQGRVLLIDDDAMVRALVRTALAKRGFEVIEAGSGEDGLVSFGAFTPDIILLDAVMPGMDGFAVCRALRERPWGADVVYLLYSDDADPVGVFPLEAAGCDAFVAWMTRQPGFNDRELARAMTSTSVARFIVLDRQADAR